jgi:hypothetical protein
MAPLLGTRRRQHRFSPMTAVRRSRLGTVQVRPSARLVGGALELFSDLLRSAEFGDEYWFLFAG